MTPNDYGGPVGAPELQYDLQEPPMCNGYWYVIDPEACAAYIRCTIECTESADCPRGGSGDAVPTCIDRQCELPCTDSTTCPTGMSCVYIDGVGACTWPVEFSAPGCPTWCELVPLPSDCPEWCAIQGVGCPSGQADYCCNGLTCGTGGFCVPAM